MTDIDVNKSSLLASAENNVLPGCYTCKHLRRETESWEMPHIWWMNCEALPSMANLKSFPFKHTSCKGYEKHESKNPELEISLWSFT